MAFCGWEMYVWAEDGILGALEGLCLAGPEFDADEPSSGFGRLDATQGEINQWGESLRVSVRTFRDPLIVLAMMRKECCDKTTLQNRYNPQ